MLACFCKSHIFKVVSAEPEAKILLLTEFRESERTEETARGEYRLPDTAGAEEREHRPSGSAAQESVVLQDQELPGTGKGEGAV